MTSIPRTLAAAVLLLAGTIPLAGTAQADPLPLRVGGTATPGGAGGAYTYDPSQLPEDTRIRVGVTYPSNGSMVVTLHLYGALPNREYGAHAHVAACGSSGTAAGGHVQQVPFPAGSSATDPAYANPQNEVWLDLATDDDGNGSAQTVVAWQPGTRRPMAVVVHAAHTSTAPGTAGTAGARLGCLTVPF